MTVDSGGIGAPRFDVVLRGYDRRQVDEHLARLHRVLSRMRNDLEIARSQPLPVVPPGPVPPGPGPVPPPARPRPTPRPRPHDGGPDMIGTFTDRMQSILQAAEEEAAEIRQKARAAARAETESVRTELADLVRQREALLAEITRLRGQQEGLLAGPTAKMPARDEPTVREKRDERTAREGEQPPQRDAKSTAGPGPRPAPQRDGNGVARPEARPGSGTGAGAEAAAGVAKAAAGPAAPPPASNGTPRAAPSGAPRPSEPTHPAPAPRSGPPRPSPIPKSRPAPAQGERPDSAAGAHRLPSGAYPAVGEQPESLRPRTEPEPEAGELFRPASGRRPGPSESGEKTRPGDVEATVAVGAVRSSSAEATVKAPAITPRSDRGKGDEQRKRDAEPGSEGSPEAGRSGSDPSRSG